MLYCVKFCDKRKGNVWKILTIKTKARLSKLFNLSDRKVSVSSTSETEWFLKGKSGFSELASQRSQDCTRSQFPQFPQTTVETQTLTSSFSSHPPLDGKTCLCLYLGSLQIVWLHLLKMHGHNQHTSTCINLIKSIFSVTNRNYILQVIGLICHTWTPIWP